MRKIPVLIAFILLAILPDPQVRAQTSLELLKQIRSSVIEKIDGREFYIHTVKRGQTLYMISKAYGVEVNDLIRENPQVKEGLKADEKIRVPVPGQPAPVPAKQVKPSAAGPKQPAAAKHANEEAAAVKPDSAVVAELPCGKDNSSKKTVYKVALMLPLYLGEVDGLNAENPDPKILESAKSLQFLPFYEGFRLALDSLEKTGIRIRLYVYDVDKDTARTRQILKKPEMKSVDLIFGLLYHRNFQIVAEFAKKNKINLVNPVSERSELVNGNPYVFKVQPSKKSQLDGLAEYMSRAFSRGQVLIVRSGQYGDKDAPDQLKRECHEHGLTVRIVEGQENAIAALSKEKDNYLVVFSDNTAYAFDLTRRLFELRNEYALTLVGLPDWSAMEGLETEYLVALKTHIIAESFIDYENPEVKKFVLKYQGTYHSDPVLLGFQGFDLAVYFLTALHAYGTGFQRCLDEMKVSSMQNHPVYRQAKGNGFENQHWMIYKYDNYRLVTVN
ncbi:MAG: ABC transporter substrate-binding protein [Bacteroidota bacterium]